MEPDTAGAAGSMGQIIAIIVLICCSAFFSMSETALTSIGKLKARTLMDSNAKGAEKLLELKEKPHKFLAAILIGNNFVNILATSIATSYAASYTFKIPAIGSFFGGSQASMIVSSAAVATAAMTFLILVFGEITPKTLASHNSERVSLSVSGIIWFLQIILTPAIIAFNAINSVFLKLFGINAAISENLVSDEVIKTITEVGHEEGVLEHDERRMINNVVDFGDYEAKSIMTPRTRIVAADISSTYAEIVDIFKTERFSRIPIYEDNIDNIVGVLFVKDLIFSEQTAEGFNLKELLRDVYFTYETKLSVELFAIMRSKRFSMSVVLDEYGGTSGIITIEDLVEEIVGEIIDEDDDAGDFELVKEDEYLVDSSARIDEVNEMIGTSFSSRNFDSIGGYVIEILGRFPKQGEKIISDGATFIIEEAEKNKIEKIRIKITQNVSATESK